MDITNDKSYKKIASLTIGKYAYIVLLNNKTICYVEENSNKSVLPNEDLTLKGNDNTSLSNLNSKILLKHIKELLEDELREGIINKNTITDRIDKIQIILQNNELYSLIKGSVNELNNFDEETSKMKKLFNRLYVDIVNVEEANNPKVEVQKPKKIKRLDETANVDAIMIAMLVNIGILLFIMLVLNIIK